MRRQYTGPRRCLLAAGAVLMALTAGAARADVAVEQEIVVGTMWEVLPLSMEARRSRFFNESEILDTLVKLDYDMTPVPGLALSWTREDPLTWRFELRPEVTFHDGTRLTAEVVANSLQHVLEALPYARSLLPIAAMEPEGELVLRIRTETPYSPLPNQLTDAFTGIYAPASFGPDGALVSPIGTGPYRFVSYQSQGDTVTERFEGYWGPEPEIDRVTYRYIPDHNTRALAVEAGEVDFADNLPPAEYARLTEVEGVQTFAAPTAGLYYMVLNTQDGSVLADPLLRQALNAVIDREAVVEFALEGVGIPAPTFFSPAFKTFPQETAHAYDLEGAGALLERAGYASDDGHWTKDGAPLTLRLHSYSTRTEMPIILEAMASELQSFGIEVELALHTWPGMVEVAEAGDYDGYLVFWTPEMIGHPDLHLTPHLHSAHNLDANGYANPELDALLEQGRALEPGAERDAVYAQALEIVHADAPIIPMVHKVFVAAASERLQGYRVHPSAFFYDFKSVTLAE
ncbi:MAG: ABC transporter substrate-binding protein [Alphaproteobacteria bacterium]